MANAAQVLARRLAAAGCRHAFGMPGGEVLTLLDALTAAGLQFDLARQETAAGFMAEGSHHVTGAPAVLLTTLGPGLTNAVNVVTNAYLDRVPLILLSGCVDPEVAAGYTHQIIDHGALLRPITKGSFTLTPGAVAEQVDQAIALATGGRPGPVHIDLPISLALREEAERPLPLAAQPEAMVPAPGPALTGAREALAQAKRPIMIAGWDAVQDGAAEAVTAFARDHGLPVVTTYKAKGVIPEDDPLALGGAGLSPLADKELLPLVAEADFILLAGYDPVEMRQGWQAPWDPTKVTVVEFLQAPLTHGMHQATMTFCGDIAAGLAALGDGLDRQPGLWSNGAPAATKAALAKAFKANETWGPAAVIDEVERHLPAETVAAVDSGAHRILLSQIWHCPAVRRLLQSNGHCTMGCALPLAMGVKRADPNRPAVAFTGDAGLDMVLGELATLRDWGLPVVVVVFVDTSLALIDLKQRQRELSTQGVDFGATDYPTLAKAFGGEGVVVRDRETLGAAVNAALAAPHFTLVAAEIGKGAYDGRI